MEPTNQPQGPYESAAGLAIDAPGIRTSLHRFQLMAAFMTAAGIGLLLTFGLLLSWSEGRIEALERDGVRVVGEVTSYRGGVRNPGWIRVEFEYLGDLRRETVNLDSESPVYEVGQHVVVIVDPDEPESMTVLGEENLPLRVLWPMIGALVLGLILLVHGLVSLVRSRRQHGLLSTAGFRSVTFTYAQLHLYRRSKRRLLLVSDRDRQQVVTVVGTPRSRQSRLLRKERHGELVGELDGYAVLRIRGSDHVVSLRPPRTERARRRWQSAADLGLME